MPSNDDEDDLALVGPEQLAELFSISRSTVSRMIRAGELPPPGFLQGGGRDGAAPSWSDGGKCSRGRRQGQTRHPRHRKRPAAEGAWMSVKVLESVFARSRARSVDRLVRMVIADRVLPRGAAALRWAQRDA
jgi:hypothetical protein